MKIGVDARVLMDKQYSGISFYTEHLLTAFLKQLKLESFDLGNIHLFYNSFVDINSLYKWEEQNVKLFRSTYPNKVFNYLLQTVFSWPKLDKFMQGVDIFYAPHFNFIKLSTKAKFVITVHDLSFLRYPEFFSFRKNFWHKFLQIRKILERADKIIAVSQNTKLDLIELLNIPANKIELIYSGNIYQFEATKNLVNLNKGWQLNSDFTPEYNKIDTFLEQKKIKKNFILYLGNIEPRKNIQGLIRAYEILRHNNKHQETQLVLAGKVGWRAKDILKTWQQSKLKGDINFISYVNEEEKRILYQKAKIFVYPSFYEGFGFPPLEAASFGLPVLCSHVASLPEIMNTGALYVNPFSSDELAEAMNLLLTQNDLRQNFISEGLKQASSYSWSETANKYYQVFKQLAS